MLTTKNGLREGSMKSRICARLLGAAAVLSFAAGVAQAAPFMIVGNDEKLLWDDNGKPVLSPPGKDSVLIVDLADPLDPKIVANLPLKNSRSEEHTSELQSPPDIVCRL